MRSAIGQFMKGTNSSPETQFKAGFIPWNKGKTGLWKHTEVWKKETTERLKHQWASGKRQIVKNLKPLSRHSKETIEKMKVINSAKAWKTAGENNYRWIKDRTKVKIGDRVLNDPRRKQWTRSVFHRDNFRCKSENHDCKGRLEAHHILTWKEHPELRYDVNNGITLCHHHHPLAVHLRHRKQYFQELVASLD